MRSPAGLVVVGAGLVALPGALACSNILVSKSAAADGFVHTSYNADDAALFGATPRYPAATHANGTLREVYSWDLGIKLGAIPEAAATYNVMGNANEHGLVIGETTHGGLEILSNVGKTQADGFAIDYGSLIWLTLQRAKTAREAIDTMVALATEFGYASAMEGFSIADPDEVWYMELLGRGDLDEGVLYVALKLPEGAVLAHANQARIREFLPCDDPETCRCSADVVEFATENGFYDAAVDGAFSFSDVFDPVTFEGARFCEARVWFVFNEVCGAGGCADFDADEFLPYAQGRDLGKRMPLWVTPSTKVSVAAMRAIMASHYEGSWFDPAVDVGAAAEHSPYRWNGLSWSVDGASYVNERPIGTQATGWHFISTIKPDVPPPMRAVLWWGADDHAWSPTIPLHGGAAASHASYDDADCMSRSTCRTVKKLPGTTTDLSFDAAWWLSNLVADVVYTRYDRAASVVKEAQKNLDATLSVKLAAAEAQATSLFEQGFETEAVEVLSRHAVEAGATATATWTALWKSLMTSFIDGMTLKLDPEESTCGCRKEATTFSDAWLEKVVLDAGDKYAEPEGVASSTSTPAETTHASTTQPKGGLRGDHRAPSTPTRGVERKAISKLAIKGVVG